MVIHLIRHGKTMANERRLYCGSTDLPLSEGGVDELAAFKAEGIYPRADLYFTSGLLRTEQTLDIIYGPVDRRAVAGIAEYKFGLFEMKSYEELKTREDYQAWITDEHGLVECPHGENKRQFEKRVIEGYGYIVGEIRSSGCDSAFISCHGGVIACIMEYLMPGERNFYEWQPKPGRGYTLIFEAVRPRVEAI